MSLHRRPHGGKIGDKRGLRLFDRIVPPPAKAHQQSLGSLCFTAVLGDLVKDISILIDGPPKPVLLTSDADDGFIQMRGIVQAWTLSSEPASIVRAEFSRHR